MNQRVLLIHGFANGIRFSVFRSRRGEDAGFSAFKEMIRAGDAAVFHWDIVEDATFWQSLTPKFALEIYRREFEKAQGEETLGALHAALTETQPQVVICHSMGCQLLLNELERFELPGSVRKVLFVQADLPRTFHLSAHATAFLSREGAAWFSLYCPWDPTLLVSAMWNRRWRAGLLRTKTAGVQNLLFPLWLPWNLHTSSIRDPRLVRWIGL